MALTLIRTSSHRRLWAEVQDGLIGQPSIHITADTVTWLAFLAKETTLLWALLTRRIRMRGNPKWLLAFSRCFPS